MTTTISNQARALKTLIAQSEGKIFSVEFIKKDGTLRKMRARLGVTAPLKGGENSVAHLPNYTTAFDMDKENYRNINLDTIQQLSVNGLKIKIV